MKSLQIEAAAKKFKYIILRVNDYDSIGFNCAALEMAKRRGFNPNEETAFTSFRPCNFMEYISNKTPFI